MSKYVKRARPPPIKKEMMDERGNTGVMRAAAAFNRRAENLKDFDKKKKEGWWQP